MCERTPNEILSVHQENCDIIKYRELEAENKTLKKELKLLYKCSTCGFGKYRKSKEDLGLGCHYWCPGCGRVFAYLPKQEKESK